MLISLFFNLFCCIVVKNVCFCVELSAIIKDQQILLKTKNNSFTQTQPVQNSTEQKKNIKLNASYLIQRRATYQVTPSKIKKCKLFEPKIVNKQTQTRNVFRIRVHLNDLFLARCKQPLWYISSQEWSLIYNLPSLVWGEFWTGINKHLSMLMFQLMRIPFLGEDNPQITLQQKSHCGMWHFSWTTPKAIFIFSWKFSLTLVDWSLVLLLVRSIYINKIALNPKEHAVEFSNQKTDHDDDDVMAPLDVNTLRPGPLVQSGKSVRKEHVLKKKKIAR